MLLSRNPSANCIRKKKLLKCIVTIYYEKLIILILSRIIIGREMRERKGENEELRFNKILYFHFANHIFKKKKNFFSQIFLISHNIFKKKNFFLKAFWNFWEKKIQKISLKSILFSSMNIQTSLYVNKQRKKKGTL